MIYEIHRCSAEEKPLLKKFIQEHWKAGHPLATSDTLLDFQHRTPDGSYNFLLAKNTLSGEIDGVFGYIPIPPSPGVYFGALWKVRDDVQNSEIRLLGVSLWRKILRLPQFQAYGVSGISEIARQFYSMARLTIGQMHHYYIPNERVADFHIAKFKDKPAAGNTGETPEAVIKTISPEEIREIKYSYYPEKDPQYLLARYAVHPFYKYDFLGVFTAGALQSVLVTRTIDTQGARCIRIVDIYGNVEQMPSIYNAVQHLLQTEKAEYIDCLNYGIDPEAFRLAGFCELDFDDPDTVIPNYFEPFVRENVKIGCAHTPKDHFVIFKGDGDQDRPNIL